jgi:DNA-binding Lrp family transcriptional regulator
MKRSGVPLGAPPSHATDLSALDQAVIRALQADGRRHAAAIARELGVSERTVRDKIASLRAEGLIEITTVTDPRLLGYRALAVVGVRLTNLRPRAEVAAELAELESVDYAVSLSSEYDILVELVCRDLRELFDAVDNGILRTSGVLSAETFPCLRLRHQQPVWGAALGRGTALGASGPATVLDETDRRLLRALNEDGRAPYNELARRTHISESQARVRIQRMVQSGAVRVMAITKARNVGFESSAWLGITAQPPVRVADLADSLAQVSAVSYLVAVAGRFDLLAEVVSADTDDLFRLLDDDIRPIAGVGTLTPFISLDIYYGRLRPAY